MCFASVLYRWLMGMEKEDPVEWPFSMTPTALSVEQVAQGDTVQFSIPDTMDWKDISVRWENVTLPRQPSAHYTVPVFPQLTSTLAVTVVLEHAVLGKSSPGRFLYKVPHTGEDERLVCIDGLAMQNYKAYLAEDDPQLVTLGTSATINYHDYKQHTSV